MTTQPDTRLEGERMRLQALIGDVKHEIANLEAALNFQNNTIADSNRNLEFAANNLGWRAQEIVRSVALIQGNHALAEMREIARRGMDLLMAKYGPGGIAEGCKPSQAIAQLAADLERASR